MPEERCKVCGLDLDICNCASLGIETIKQQKVELALSESGSTTILKGIHASKAKMLAKLLRKGLSCGVEIKENNSGTATMMLRGDHRDRMRGLLQELGMIIGEGDGRQSQSS